MIKKLFEETEEEQYRYLKPRLMAFGVGSVPHVLIWGKQEHKRMNRCALFNN